MWVIADINGWQKEVDVPTSAFRTGWIIIRPTPWEIGFLVTTRPPTCESIKEFRLHHNGTTKRRMPVFEYRS